MNSLVSFILLNLVLTVTAQATVPVKFLEERRRQYVVRKYVKPIPGVFLDLPAIEVRVLTDSEAERLRGLGYRVELNRKMKSFGQLASGATTPTKPLWALEAIHAREANQFRGGNGEGVTVCLVDTGVTLHHPALSGQVVDGANFTSVGAANDFSDSQGHGTLIGGIIAGRDVGNYRGVAPGVKLLVAKALDRAGVGDYAAIARALQYCIGRSQIINMSLGSDEESQVVSDVIDQAIVSSGMTVIAAAGNSPNLVSFPARHPRVIAVGAIDAQLNVSKFSGRGAKLDYVAPGEEIFGPCVVGYGVYSGTSLSAGFVTATEAIRQARKTEEIRSVDLGKPVTDQGLGLVDAELTAK